MAAPFPGLLHCVRNDGGARQYGFWLRGHGSPLPACSPRGESDGSWESSMDVTSEIASRIEGWLEWLGLSGEAADRAAGLVVGTVQGLVEGRGRVPRGGRKRPTGRGGRGGGDRGAAVGGWGVTGGGACDGRAPLIDPLHGSIPPSARGETTLGADFESSLVLSFKKERACCLAYRWGDGACWGLGR